MLATCSRGRICHTRACSPASLGEPERQQLLLRHGAARVVPEAVEERAAACLSARSGLSLCHWAARAARASRRRRRSAPPKQPRSLAGGDVRLTYDAPDAAFPQPTTSFDPAWYPFLPEWKDLATGCKDSLRLPRGLISKRAWVETGIGAGWLREMQARWCGLRTSDRYV
jgi:hypothetical protein